MCGVALKLQARITETSDYNNFTDIDEDTLEEFVQTRLRLKEMLPHAFNKLNLGTIKIMSASITLADVEVPFEDYSFVLYPALKATEATMLQILRSLSILIPRNTSLGSLFCLIDSSGDYTVKPGTRYYSLIPSEYREPLSSLYNIMNHFRNQYFHPNRDPELVSYISSREYALELLNQIYVVIDSTEIGRASCRERV